MNSLTSSISLIIAVWKYFLVLNEILRSKSVIDLSLSNHSSSPQDCGTCQIGTTDPAESQSNIDSGEFLTVNSQSLSYSTFSWLPESNLGLNLPPTLGVLETLPGAGRLQQLHAWRFRRDVRRCLVMMWRQAFASHRHRLTVRFLVNNFSQLSLSLGLLR